MGDEKSNMKNNTSKADNNNKKNNKKSTVYGGNGTFIYKPQTTENPKGRPKPPTNPF